MNPHQPTRTEKLFDRALKVLPGGVSRNAALRRPNQAYAEYGEGCHLIDLEGVRRIDFANNMAALIHGHAHPAIVRAVTARLHRGTAFSLATEIEVEFAEHMCSRSEHFDKIRFVNSGTEAVMCAVKAARAFTGRPKIAKVEGAYHGVYDYAEVSQTAKPQNWGSKDCPESVPVVKGTPASALCEVVVIPFNDPQRALAILDEHRGDLACVLVDPLPHRVGMMPADPEYLRALRDWTDEDGSLLVFDEVITFRNEYGGAQEWYDVRPDLTALGKMIGGGFPVGAVAGHDAVMEVFNPLAEKVLFPHSGTFCANPVTMTAGLTAMRMFDRYAVEQLNELGDRTRRQIQEVIRAADVPACVTGGGSMFRIHMKPDLPKDYRGSYESPEEAARAKALVGHLFDHGGVLLIGTCSGMLSTPMTGAEIDQLCDSLLAAFRSIRGMWPDTAPTPEPSRASAATPVTA